MKENNLRQKNQKNKIVIAILLLIAVIGVGYATLGANLRINGVANIPTSSWNVQFKANSIQVTTGSVAIDTTNNESAATITNPTQVDYAVKLALPGDYYEFTVVAENTGSIDAMIDTVVSKRDNIVITTGTLPSYIDYSVTYADGVAIAPHHLLTASTEETYKVRIEFKKEIEASELPSEAVTLNLNFQINYVQADSTAVEVTHPFTGIKYGVYPYANRLYLDQAVPANVILHSTPSDALADWTNPSVMNETSQPFYLKHKIENDVVTETYVVFTVTPEMAQANPGMTAGTYELRGGINEENASEKPYFIQNAKTIYDAFGTNCSSNPYITTPSFNFTCSVSGLIAGAHSRGYADALDGSSSSCNVDGDAASGCY